jgi:hypothetical protein
VVVPLFLHRRKTRKIEKSQGSVQRLFSDCELDTWVNEKKPSALSDLLLPATLTLVGSGPIRQNGGVVFRTRG